MNGFFIVLTENREIKRVYMKIEHVVKYIKENKPVKVIREAFNQEAIVSENGEISWKDLKSTDYNG